MQPPAQLGTATSPALAWQNAAFTYGGPPALREVTGSLAPGEALALIGPNGSGKTTLLRGILGLIELAEGEQHVLGQKANPKTGSQIGYVPQLTDIDPTFPITVRGVVEMGVYQQLSWWQSPRRYRQKIDQTLARVSLTEKARWRYGTLSGGQQQRALLARALVGDPKIMLLDEPFNGLDQPHRQSLLEIIRALKAEGVALVISTHDMDLAWAVCEQAMLVNGRQIACGPIAQVLSEPNLREAFGGLPDQGAAKLAEGGDGAPVRTTAPTEGGDHAPASENPQSPTHTLEAARG
ncbi:metal ABC transporter ATP-binding protein [Boudabousia tangfeifanii]|nr:ABC transporter ATP-binding protein [Boudabousia tangfeifanii]